MNPNKIASMLRENAVVKDIPKKSLTTKAGEATKAVGKAVQKAGEAVASKAQQSVKAVGDLAKAHPKTAKGIAGAAMVGAGAGAAIAAKKLHDSKSKAKKVKEDIDISILLQEMMLFEIMHQKVEGDPAATKLMNDIKATKDPLKLKALWAKVRTLPKAIRDQFNKLPKSARRGIAVAGAAGAGAAVYGAYKGLKKKQATQESVDLVQKFIKEQMHQPVAGDPVAAKAAMDPSTLRRFYQWLQTQKTAGTNKFSQMGKLGKAGVVGGGLATAGAAGYGLKKAFGKPVPQQG